MPGSADLMPRFDHFIAVAKSIFSDALGNVFLVAACLMAVSLIFVFFLPEIPLRKSDKPATEEMGRTLSDEMGQNDKEDFSERQAANSKRTGMKTGSKEVEIICFRISVFYFFHGLPHDGRDQLTHFTGTVVDHQMTSIFYQVISLHERRGKDTV
jgi:hypothetical protein